MLLAIDAGNTNIVFAVLTEDGTSRGQWRISTDARRTSDEYAVWLIQLMALGGLSPRDVSASILASVVPGATEHLVRLCTEHFGSAPFEVRADDPRLGIEVLLTNPKEAGADRVVNAISARARYRTPLVVVDIGTATNFDVVDRDGNFRGGIIAPGPQPSVDALQRIAAKLPRIEIERPASVIGNGTIPAMQSGVFWGYVGLIEGLTARIEAELGEPITVIGTGGLTRLFQEATGVIQHIDPDITIRGLSLIHRALGAEGTA